MPVIAIHKLRRFGLIALLVFVLGQAGLLLHDATVDHPVDDVCELCSGFDRMAASPTPQGGGIFQLAVAIVLSGLAASVVSLRFVRVNNPRGPPTL